MKNNIYISSKNEVEIQRQYYAKTSAQYDTMHINDTKQHVVLLDFVRFLAALSVMIYHLCYWKNGHIPTDVIDSNNFWWFGWVGVQIFFLLSGYVIAFSASKATPLSFARSRFLRLIPTIWICASITLVAKLLLDNQLLDLDLLYSYLSTLIIYPLGVHIDVVYWTLTVECAFYFLVYLVLRLSTFPKLMSLMIFIGVLSSLYNILIILMDLNLLNELLPKFSLLLNKLHHMRTTRLLLLEHGIYFSLGVLLWYLTQKPKNDFSIRVISFVFAIVCSLTVLNASNEYILEHHAVGVFEMSPLIVFLTAFILICFAQRLGRTHFLNSEPMKIALRFLGLTTFPLYLLHNDAGLLILSHLSGVMPDLVALILTIVICIVTAVITFKIIEPFALVFFKQIWDVFEHNLRVGLKKA